MTGNLIVFLSIATLKIAALGQTQNQPEVRRTCDLSLSQAPAITRHSFGNETGRMVEIISGERSR